ncbi:MAG: hypothetical protein GTO45_32685 [Candidatus Aminicenantes bacterium]|nr:hypothetical protein [Candidatus Aminicenantes bacterium]NIM83508.1 hypothetical protein [Candidatus Aminicenantes bacterium]NIN22897.1 hypothetical protein [Candidatus Aminicenantes bacterium]NIN46636.1 hypothetical protein [Candidatus Aminicenantes bacterium]NIN89539.1 hypothetical protein [Candidatus Aminicenantes bacterium]
MLIIIAAFYFTVGFVEFRKDIGSSIGTILGSLLIISLLLERALDVFLTTWRAEGSERLDSEIKEIKQKIDQLKKAGKADTDPDVKTEMGFLSQKNQEKLTHRSKTRIIAMWSSLILGVIVSAIGFRVLATLVDPGSYTGMEDKQKNFFDFVDILMTGGLLAGGSDGIHKIMDLYRVFMEGSSARVKSKSETAQ